MDKEYDIQEFHPDLINPTISNYRSDLGGSKIIVIGKAGTGKSTLIKYLILLKRDIIPVGMVISGTEESNRFYSKVFPSTYIFNEYSNNVINEFVERQKKAITWLENPWALLLLDDCTDDKKIFSTNIQQTLFKNGRHLKLLYILSLQHPTDIPPSIRTNTDGIFLFKETNEINLKNIYLNYAGVIPDFKIFKEYMSKITGNYTALYIDNTSNDNRAWYEKVYYWKVPVVSDNLKFGCPEYRASSRKDHLYQR